MSKMVMPIEEWMSASERVRCLVNDFELAALNSIDFNFAEFHSEDFKRLCAISLRNFLDDLTEKQKGS